MNDPAGRLSWDDLRIIKAIGRNGTIGAAAAALGLNSSTIARRLAKLEQVLGATLFDRRRSGYSATVKGSELIALAERVELDVVSVARRISGRGQGHSGELRITTSDSVLLYLVTPLVASFRSMNPAVQVEVSVSNAFLNLARGETDVAVRATDDPPENLFGRKVAKIAWAPYDALPVSGPGRPPAEALVDRPWVSFSGQLSGLKATRLVEDRVGGDAIVYRTDSVVAAATGIAAGLGVGYLPCMLGDLHPNLVRVGAIEPALDDELWLLTHPDIRRSDRIQGFMRHCIDALSRNRGLIEGRSARRPGIVRQIGVRPPLLLGSAPP